MKSTPLHELLFGPIALVCVVAVLVGVALEATDEATAPARTATTGSPAP
jgi:hypothetical protein